MPNKRPGTRIYLPKNASLYGPYLALYEEFFFYIKCMSLHILTTQFLIKTTNPPNLVVHKSWYLYNLSLGRLLEGDPLECCFKKQTLAQIVLQATLHTIFEICHPILLFGTILLFNLCDLPPYTLIWHYMFIRHTRVKCAHL